MTTTSVPDLSGRRAPALGGFNLTALSLEIRRLRRNPRAVIITVIVPKKKEKIKKEKKN